MQQLAERQAQRSLPGSQQPQMLPQPHQNGRMQSTGNSWMYQQYAHQLDMYDRSGFMHGQAPVNMQYPGPAGMSAMPHPDGMYCGPLAYAQTPGQVQPSEQRSVEAVTQQAGQLCFPQLSACEQTRPADMSFSEASPTGMTEEDEAHQFRVALRYASH